MVWLKFFFFFKMVLFFKGLFGILFLDWLGWKAAHITSWPFLVLRWCWGREGADVFGWGCRLRKVFGFMCSGFMCLVYVFGVLCVYRHSRFKIVKPQTSWTHVVSLPFQKLSDSPEIIGFRHKWTKICTRAKDNVKQPPHSTTNLR